MLVGLVKKNGIMMVDFAIEARRRDVKTPSEAIYEACLVRFRPIMMTTMAALAGTLPIALGFGAGAESRQPLGLAVVGGLLVSQTLTLYLTPVFYTYMESLSGLLSRRRAVGVAFERPGEGASAGRARRGRLGQVFSLQSSVFSLQLHQRGHVDLVERSRTDRSGEVRLCRRAERQAAGVNPGRLALQFRACSPNSGAAGTRSRAPSCGSIRRCRLVAGSAAWGLPPLAAQRVTRSDPCAARAICG